MEGDLYNGTRFLRAIIPTLYCKNTAEYGSNALQPRDSLTNRRSRLVNNLILATVLGNKNSSKNNKYSRRVSSQHWSVVAYNAFNEFALVHNPN